MPWETWSHQPAFWLVILLLLMNLAGFILMGVDKYKARRERWRIPERTLMLIAALGGSVGVFLGMRVFRHKTLHRLFSWGVPALFVLQAAIAVYLLWLR